MKKTFTNTTLKATTLFHLACLSFSGYKFVSLESNIPIPSHLGTQIPKLFRTGLQQIAVAIQSYPVIFLKPIGKIINQFFLVHLTNELNSYLQVLKTLAKDNIQDFLNHNSRPFVRMYIYVPLAEESKSRTGQRERFKLITKIFLTFFLLTKIN